MKPKPHIIAVINDPHGQYVDWKTFNAVLDMLKDVKPDEVVVNGDLVDFPSISRFQVGPVNPDTIRGDWPDALRMLQRIRGCIGKKAKLVFIRGNHEKRLDKYMAMHPELKGVEELDIRVQLNFDALNIKYKPYVYMPYKHHRFVITHGVACGVTAASRELARHLCSGYSGHIHKHAEAFKDGTYETIKWVSGGGIACKKKLDEMYSEDLRGHQGIALITREEQRKPQVLYYEIDERGFYCAYNNKFYKRY